MRKKEFIFILTVTFIVIVIWIIANIIHVRPSEPISPQLQDALQPVEPTFDSATLDRISQSPSSPSAPAQTQTVVQPTPLPTKTPSPTPTPLPTSSPIGTSSASASSSGALQ